jgi:hypothetical protein
MSDEEYIKKLEERVEYLKSDIDNKGICLPTVKLKTYHKHGILFFFILIVLLYFRPSVLYSRYFDKEKQVSVEYFCWSKLFVSTFMIYTITITGYYYYVNR